MKPSRWLLTAAYFACALWWIEHFAALFVMSQMYPREFWNPARFLLAVAFLLPCLFAVGAIRFARRSQGALSVVTAALAYCVYSCHIFALWAAESSDAESGPDEPGPPVPISHGLRVYVLGLYWLVASFVWFGLAIGCGFGKAIATGLRQLGAWLAGDFREPLRK